VRDALRSTLIRLPETPCTGALSPGPEAKNDLFWSSRFDYDGLYVLFAKRLSVGATSM
jgi:hypothetical protein